MTDPVKYALHTPLEVSPQRLEEIKAREAAAQPGPWLPTGDANVLCAEDASREEDVVIAYVYEPGATTDSARIGGPVAVANAAFIAHARADIPELLAYVALLESLLGDRAQDSDLALAAVRLERQKAARTLRACAEFEERNGNKPEARALSAAALCIENGDHSEGR